VGAHLKGILACIYAGQTAFWSTMQQAFNSFCRKRFIVDTDQSGVPLHLVLDDDKAHYATKKKETDGMIHKLNYAEPLT